MKSKKLCILPAILLIFSMLFCNVTVSAESFDAVSITNNSDIKKGEEITISLNLTNLSDINKGINAYKATLNYDKNIFEPISLENFSSENGWKQLMYNDKNNEFVAVKPAGVKSDEELVKIKFIAKNDIKAGKTEISFTNIVASEGKRDIVSKSGSAVTQINIIEQTDVPQVDSPSQQSTPPNSRPNTHSNIPNTGVGNGYILIVLILDLSVIAILLLINKKRTGKTIKNKQGLIISALFLALISFQTGAIVYASSQRGDIDENSTIDYSDVQLLQQHIIDYKNIEKNKLYLADMNCDGKVTVTDLSILVSKVEDSLEYSVDLEADLPKVYFEKNEEFNLNLLADSSYCSYLTEITLNGKTYTVQKQPDSKLYIVPLNAPDTAGVHEINISDVKLNTGKTVKTNFVKKIEVLKDVPSINDYQVQDLVNDSKINVSFRLDDNDKALKNASMDLISSEGNIINTYNLKTGDNQFKIDVQPEEEYKLIMRVDYNRDSDLITPEVDNSGNFVMEKSLRLVIDYNFTISNIKAYDSENNETSIFDKNQPIIIGFDSSNSTKFIPQTVTINGKDYPVEKIDDRYYVQIDGFENVGTNQITIEKVSLSNGKSFDITSDNTTDVAIRKQKPSINDFTFTEDVERNTINVSFATNDKDKTIEKLTYIIKDDKGNIIREQQVSDNPINDTFDWDNEVLTSTYTVTVVADYSLVEGQTITEEVLLEQTIDAKPKAILNNTQLSKNPLEKGENLDIIYTISSNQKSPINKIVVNNQEVEVTKLADNQYQIHLTMGNTAGEHDITISNVIFENGNQATVNGVSNVEILKSHISVDNYKVQENPQNSKVVVNFDINDIDDAFVSARFELIDVSDNSIVKQQDITGTGNQSIELRLDDTKRYTIKVIATYKRDQEGSILVSDKVLLEQPIQIVIDYDLQVSNLQTFKGETPTKYFEKEYNDVIVRFMCTNSTSFIPTKATINNQEYDLTDLGNNTYQTTIKAPAESGIYDIVISNLTLNNSTQVDVNQNNQTQIDVLKSLPSMINFEYDNNQEQTISFKFTVDDMDNALTGGKVVVSDGNTDIFSSSEIVKGENSFSFTITESEKYTATISLNYDLDTNTLSTGDNEGTIPYTEEIDIVQQLIELKDVEYVQLYTKNGDSAKEVTKLDINQFNPENYIAKVVMKDLPAFYSEIEEGKVTQDGQFKLVLKYSDSVQYENGSKRNRMEVRFGELENGVVTNITFEELIKIIKQNPGATIKLTNDLDASSIYLTDNAYIDIEEFYGVLDGNGYKIKNLKKPLFQHLQGATIKNLVIENSNVSGDVRGILANTSRVSTIQNVHIVNSQISSNTESGTGGLVGEAQVNTKILQCSANNIVVKGTKRVGGLVGSIRSGSQQTIIDNSYVKGTIIASKDAIGGLVGQTSDVSSTIKNSYVEVELKTQTSHAVGGIVGYSDRNSVILQNNISLAKGDSGYKISGTGISGSSSNNYEIKESNLTSNSNNSSISEIEISKINPDFLKTTMKWDKNVWRLDNANGKNMPTLKNNDPLDLNNNDENNKPQNPNLYIPELKRLKSYPTYNTANEIAYHNVYKLIPFYDAKFIVEYGNKIANDSLLNTTTIKMILPYNSDGKMLTGLNTDNYNSIAKIRVVFENKQTRDYTVTFNKKINDVAGYLINELGISYTYNQFILNKNISLVNEIIEKAKSLDYKTQIANLTSEDESRLYVDYYNESVKVKINEVVLSLLSNIPEYNLYLDNDILTTKISQDLTNDSQLERILYSYNYFNKWYNTEIGGIPLSDVIFLSANYVNPDFDILKLVNIVMSSQNRGINQSINFYNSEIKPNLGNMMNIKEFLEYYIQILANYDDPAEWFKDNFKGVLNEKPLVGKENEVKYRAWDLLNARNHLLLPVLSAPQQDMYLITVPSQLVIGSMNRYGQYFTGNPDDIRNFIDRYATLISNFYNTSATFIKDAPSILNSNIHIQYDTRFGFPEQAPTPGTQNPGNTQDPVIKWVYEPINVWAADKPFDAYANGTDVFWVHLTALGGDYSFKVFTHETAHNQDGSYFYERNGKRHETWSEDHADDNIAQDIYDGSFVFNLRRDENVTENLSNNLTLDRISSPEKIHSYYKEMFETFYVLDYLTAQAFLDLTPEQQSKIAVKVYHSNNGFNEPGSGNTDYENGGRDTDYRMVSAEEFRNMNLQTMEDLWNNGIALRQPGKIHGTQPGSYKGDNHYNIYWYQPHNNANRPDSYSFKRLGFEMLGVGGYSDGYVTYRSTKSANDLDALRKITKDPNITWKQYKLNRYEFVKNNLDRITFFDVDQVIQQYKIALENDANAGNRNNTNALRGLLFSMVKRATKDFSTGGIYSSDTDTTVKVSSAEQLINAINSDVWGTYELTNDLDFSNVSVGNHPYINNRPFVGRIIGNGHKITGLKSTLISNMVYSEIQDLIIENPVYLNSSSAIIANNARSSLISNVKIVNSNANLPIINNKEGLVLIMGDSGVAIKNHEISSLEDLQQIVNSDSPVVNRLNYILTNDIDVSSLNNGNSIIKGEFKGVFDGNGHSLSNLAIPLFDSLKGTVKNLTIDGMNFNNRGVSNVGAIAKTANFATIDKINLNNINIVGREQLGGIVGHSSNSTVSRITATGININVDRYYAGSIIGRTSGADVVKNCVVSGEMTLTATHNGGVVGALEWGGTIQNVFADIQMKRPWSSDNRSKNGGIFGALENDRPTNVSNSVVVSNMDQTIYKVASGADDKDKQFIQRFVSNVYEVDSTTGISNIYPDRDNVKSTNVDALRTKEFYTNTLNWSEDIWDFSEVANGGRPKIK